MSVTFFLQSGETLYPTCPDCGKTIRDPGYTDCKREDCLGYGPDSVSNTPELNISNTNARAFLRVLGIHNPELAGELDPTEVKRQLAVAAMRIPHEVRPSTQEGNCYTSGLSEEQLRRYCARLSAIAEIAERRRETINYG